jgi:hypothetical protein
MQLRLLAGRIARVPHLENFPMNHCCLQVEVTLNVPSETWLAACDQAVPTMCRLEGLLWKLWVLDDAAGSAGGLYLFRDVVSARAYADGPVLDRLRKSGAARDVRVRLFPIVDHLSRRTFGLPALSPGGIQNEPRAALGDPCTS